MKLYHVAISSIYGLFTVIVKYENPITLKTIKDFKENCLMEASRLLLIELTNSECKVLSWQEIEEG